MIAVYSSCSSSRSPRNRIRTRGSDSLNEAEVCSAEHERGALADEEALGRRRSDSVDGAIREDTDVAVFWRDVDGVWLFGKAWRVLRRVDERQDVRRCPRNRDHGGVCVSEWISDHRRGLVDVSIIPRLTRYEVCAFNGVYADCYYRYFSGFVVRFRLPKLFD